jgi:hypothetical protein
MENWVAVAKDPEAICVNCGHAQAVHHTVSLQMSTIAPCEKCDCENFVHPRRAEIREARAQHHAAWAAKHEAENR